MIQTALPVAPSPRANGPGRRDVRPAGDDFEAALRAAAADDRSDATTRPASRAEEPARVDDRAVVDDRVGDRTDGRVADEGGRGAGDDGSVAGREPAEQPQALGDGASEGEESAGDGGGAGIPAEGSNAAAAGAVHDVVALTTAATAVAVPVDTGGVVADEDGTTGTTESTSGTAPTSATDWTLRRAGFEGPPVHRTGDVDGDADVGGETLPTTADAAAVEGPGTDGTPSTVDADPVTVAVADPSAEAEAIPADAATEATDATDATDATEATTDATEATGATTDAAEATDATEADGGPDVDTAAPVHATPDGTETTADGRPPAGAPGGGAGRGHDAPKGGRADGLPAGPAPEVTSTTAGTVVADAATPGADATPLDDAPDATPVGGATPTLPTTAPPSAAPTTAAAPQAPAPPVAEQLVGQVRPLLERPDGTHELHIELHPAELGQVRLQVTLEDGVISVRVHAEDPASRRLLAQSMGELRNALEASGVRAGDLDVDGGTSGRHDDGRNGPDGRPARRDSARIAHDEGARRPLTSHSSALDVLL